MAQPTAVILVVGLTRGVLGTHTPHLSGFAAAGEVRTLAPVFPAVTCTVQSSMVTGRMPGVHGIVGNGWYDRELAEVRFWKQSNRLVAGEKVWEAAARRDPAITTLNMFWWFNMYSSAAYSLTPRPMYKADGRKVPDCYSRPAELRDQLQGELGAFPLFQFWGPGASIRSSQWIADATRLAMLRHRPGLTLVYLPHLDYAHQKFGPGTPESRAAEAEVDSVFGGLLAFLRDRGVRPIVVSEYGIEPVSRAVPINRVLREAGFVTVRTEDGRELLDAGASAAFAVADHQAAHIYVRDQRQIAAVAKIVAGLAGVDACLDAGARQRGGIDHPRAGELLAVASAGAWFTYGWWSDDRRAPDFARTVDIHRKPGYDPLELFIDPALRWPRLAVGSRLMRRKLGLRTLLDVIPLDPSLVKGSHGRMQASEEHRPVLMTERGRMNGPETVSCCAVRDVVLGHLFDEPASVC